MMWFKRATAAEPTALDTMATNPVGWSSMTPPQFMSNQSPYVSPLVSGQDMTPQQRIGAFLMGKHGQPTTEAQLPDMATRGQAAMDNALTVAGAVLPTAGTWRPNAVADEIARTLNGEGFKVSISRGNGPVGQSSYLNIFDPQTNRFLMKEVRVSDHMTGGARMPHYNHVTSPEDVPGIYELARAMRARGTAASVPSAPSAVSSAHAANEATARALSDGAAKAFPEEWARVAEKTGAAAKKARNELRKRFAAMSQKSPE